MNHVKNRGVCSEWLSSPLCIEYVIFFTSIIPSWVNIEIFHMYIKKQYTSSTFVQNICPRQVKLYPVLNTWNIKCSDYTILVFDFKRNKVYVQKRKRKHPIYSPVTNLTNSQHRWTAVRPTICLINIKRVILDLIATLYKFQRPGNSISQCLFYTTITAWNIFFV